jgi:hypothetical protein
MVGPKGFHGGIRLFRRDRLSYKRDIASGEAAPEKATSNLAGPGSFEGA